MNRNSLLEMSGRVMHQLVRMTLNKGNDNPMMQELNFDGMNSDGRNFVERVQAFGMSTVPLPRDEQKGGAQGGGGGTGGGVGGDGEQAKGPAAEGIAAFIGGQRNHPVVIAIDDRRHRPLGMKPGESFQYDHQGQGTLVRLGATYLLSLDDDGNGQAPGGKMLRDAEGRETGQSEKQERFASLRHVVKKKQDRKKGGGTPAGNLRTWADAGHDISKFTAEERAQAERAPNHEDYKHEGDSVNTEVRTTAKRIEFRSGDDVVGYYDKGAKKWVFVGEIRLGKEDASHPIYGVNGGAGMTTKTSGDGAVLVDAPQPGPPTSLDGQPFEARDAEIAALKERVAALEARISNGR
jgi:hypothetical protein